jgi:hypothetical protein
MARCRDYLDFAVRFFGLGYVALWPLSTPDRGDLFGASVLCNGGLFDAVCDLPHPLRFGIGFHAAGVLCALLAVLGFAAAGMRRVRRRSGVVTPDVSLPASPPSALAAPKRPRRPVPPPRKNVPPRDHFGLRGVPH